MDLSAQNFSTQSLDHLGLIASVIDKLGIIEEIDRRLPLNKTKGAKVSNGRRAAALILNGFGFMGRRLYILSNFLSNKPVERLLGPKLSAEDFNDDCLGRCLDRIYEYGTTKLFSEVSLAIAAKFDMVGRSVHIDTTTLSLYGDYNYEDDDDNWVESFEAITSEIEAKNHRGTTTESETAADTNTKVSEEEVARPRFGFPKNKRFDLKQMVLLLATTGKAGFPLWMQAHSGNASDKKELEQAAVRIKAFRDELKSAPDMLFIADSAAYDACLQNEQLLWLSRVPETHKLARQWLSSDTNSWDWQKLDDDYRMAVKQVTYRNVVQRWALVFSQQAFIRESKTLDKSILKEQQQMETELKSFSHKTFACEKDAHKALQLLTKNLKYHRLAQVTSHEQWGYLDKGRPKPNTAKVMRGVKLEVKLVRDEEEIALRRSRKGKFILATNQLDAQALPDLEILREYKEQSKVERGFRFIKDQQFMISSVFLKNAERISALMMIMTLTLMVYNMAEYLLREELRKHNDTVPNQAKKPIQNPTMRWICEMFQGVAIVRVSLNNEQGEFVSNVTEVLRKIVRYFGTRACEIYDVPPS